MRQTTDFKDEEQRGHVFTIINMKYILHFMSYFSGLVPVVVTWNED